MEMFLTQIKKEGEYMLKKILAVMVVLCFSLSMPVWAKEKSVNEKALLNANENAAFKKNADWAAKAGKDAEKEMKQKKAEAEKQKAEAEKKAKKQKAEAEKKAKEQKAKAEKEAQKKKAEAEKRAKQEKEKAAKGMEKAKKGFGL